MIVVRSPDPRFFEQAIFLMKEDAFHNGTVSADQVVAEARQAAAGYIRRNAEDGLQDVCRPSVSLQVGSFEVS